MLEPSIKEMLNIAEGVGLTKIDEAYDFYLNHYDCFFSINNFQEQNIKLTQDLKDHGFTEVVDGYLRLKDLKITDALFLIGD